ncbi:hypothetical protein GCM10007858_37410 [Bradyrhizobium liaoningense]|nr:hypothetical protein GCM10007858_37410 [Bradyrhizobium liaoningense]
MTIRNTRTGGQILIDQLVAQGVERVTCVPGESYLAALDALHDSPIDVVICRAEGGAAMMAEAYGKLTGRPGVCFVTRGPGATNASHGVHIAMQDSTPMILFVGQVDTGMREREAFQELDYKAVFGSMAKWAVEIDRPDRIPELVARAFRVAMQGRPGPVVIALPENMLTETAAVADAMRIEPAVSWPAPADIERVGAMLASAKAPLVILGGTRWTDEATRSIARFAERFDLPVATSFRRASLIDADHSHYAGDLGIGPSPGLKARIEGADVILLVGGRMSEMPSSSYTLLDIPTPQQKLNPCASRLRRARPGLSAGACDPGDSRRLRRRRRDAEARRRGGLEGRGRQGARRLSRLDREGARAAGLVPVRPGDDVVARPPAEGRYRLQRSRQLCRLDPSPSPLPQLCRPARADFGLDGLRRSGRRARQTAVSGSRRRRVRR